MPFIYYDPKSSILGAFETLKNESTKQDNIKRAVSYHLIGEIDETHSLKSIINEMQDVTAPFIERAERAVVNSSDDVLVFGGRNVRCYLLEQGDKLSVLCISIPTLGENRNRVGFSAYSAELELKGKDVIISNQMHQLDFTKGALASVKDESEQAIGNAGFTNPFMVMVQLHQYMTDGSSKSFEALRKSCNSITELEKSALIQCLQHEVIIIVNGSDDAQKELLINRLIAIFSITADLPGRLVEVVLAEKETALLEECFDKFCKNQNWKSVKAAGLDLRYKQNEKYTLTYVCSKLMPLLLSLITALKLHILQYFIVHIPLALTLATGMTLAASYVVAMSVASSLACIALSYAFLGYISDKICVVLYSNNEYICYKKFCYEASLKDILSGLCQNFNDAINSVSQSINSLIEQIISKFTSYVKSYYSANYEQKTPKALELKDLILHRSAMKIVQSLMLVGSLLCLLLPAYQLSCGITILAAYVVFSWGVVIPNKSKIIKITGSSAKATEASNLFSCATPGVKAYDSAAEFLDYTSSAKPSA